MFFDDQQKNNEGNLNEIVSAEKGHKKITAFGSNREGIILKKAYDKDEKKRKMCFH